MSGGVAVELCDNKFNRLWELTTGTFEGVLRANEPGQWRTEFHLDEIPRDLLQRVDAVVVRDARRILFAGYRYPVDQSTGGTSRRIDGSGRWAAIEGSDCWLWLTSRVVYPDPATEEPWGQAVDVRAGQGGPVVDQFIAWNVGALALPNRQIAGLAISSAPVGSNGEWSGRLQPLSTLASRIATESGIVVEPTLDKDRLPTVSIRAASDRSKEVVLADISDLAEAEQRDVPASATWVLAAGQGSGVTRMFRSAGSASGINRLEQVTEQINATTSNELYQIAEAHRRAAGFAFFVSGRTSEQAAEQYRYIDDYQLGDLVSVQVYDYRFRVPISAVNISWAADRVIETPVLGTYTPNLLRGMRKDVLGLADRFNSNIA